MRWLLSVSFLSLVVSLVACGPSKPTTSEPPLDVKACTEEAKVCPDGSAVGRTQPNCEFAPCPPGGAPAPSAAP